MKIGAIAGSGMLLLFTLKFILKIKNHKAPNRVKINIKENPALKEFVDQICKKTRAPKPKAVYMDPDVNAYVSYSNMWLSLFLPIRKELTIGLGLVSCLNLSEFKAVIAHEFGHFAQRSMKIGSYIVTANTIIHDMIFTRDKWDNTLEGWKNSGSSIALVAFLMMPVIWIIRQILNLFYQFLNIMYSSLSREMEFNADKVAVSVAGSDAIVSGLWKLNHGFATWNTTLDNAYLAAQKELYVKNLYSHNHQALNRLKEEKNHILENLPEHPRGGKQFFNSSENSEVSMYASHPPNDMRQENAKSPYIACEQDDRSPWVLFDDPKARQEEMTFVIYNQYLGKKPDTYTTEEEFESFIRAESQGNELMEEYSNTFTNRFFRIPEIDSLRETLIQSSENPKAVLDRLKQQLSELMKPVAEIEALLEKLQQIAQGTSKEKFIVYNEKKYGKNRLQEIYELLMKDREGIFEENFKEWDSELCRLHYTLATETGNTSELLNFYKQHQTFNEVYKEVIGVRNQIVEKLNKLQARGQVPIEEIHLFSDDIYHYIDDLNVKIKSLNEINFIPLPNIDSIEELKGAIVTNGEFKQEKRSIFENGGFDRIMQTIESALLHCQRIDQKSVIKILEFHRQLFKEYEHKINETI